MARGGCRGETGGGGMDACFVYLGQQRGRLELNESVMFNK